MPRDCSLIEVHVDDRIRRIVLSHPNRTKTLTLACSYPDAALEVRPGPRRRDLLGREQILQRGGRRRGDRGDH